MAGGRKLKDEDAEVLAQRIVNLLEKKKPKRKRKPLYRPWCPECEDYHFGPCLEEEDD